MSSIPQVATTLQTVLGPDLEPIGRRTGLIQRLRKFSAEILLKMLVFTLLKCPSPKTKNYVSFAAQLGLIITERAVKKRFTPQLVTFLRGARASGATHGGCHAGRLPVAGEVHQRPRRRQHHGDTAGRLRPGISRLWRQGGLRHSGAEDSGPLGLDHGTTAEGAPRTRPPQRRQERRRRGDAACQVAVAVGSGSFCLKRFRRWTAAGAFWISRWQPGTVVLTPEGTPLDLLQRLRRHTWDGPLDIAVLLGSTARVACRLIALRVPPEVAARRRQKAYEKAQKSGRTPTRAHLQWCDWTILVTNCSTELLTWKRSWSCTAPGGRLNCCSNFGSRTTAWRPTRSPRAWPGRWRSSGRN